MSGDDCAHHALCRSHEIGCGLRGGFQLGYRLLGVRDHLLVADDLVDARRRLLELLEHTRYAAHNLAELDELAGANPITRLEIRLLRARQDFYVAVSDEATGGYLRDGIRGNLVPLLIIMLMRARLVRVRLISSTRPILTPAIRTSAPLSSLRASEKTA